MTGLPPATAPTPFPGSHTMILLGCDIFAGGGSLYKTLKVTGELYGLSEVIAELGRRFAMPSRKTAAPAPESPSSGTTTTQSAS